MDIAHLIETDSWRMEILRAVAPLRFPDWAIGAGFVRAAVWDALTGKPEPTPLPDIDVIYFDPENTSRAHEDRLSSVLAASLPDISWDLKNQARMHLRNGDAPYRDTEDALAHWMETPTCVAARLDDAGRVSILSPHGVEDLLALRVRPTAAAHMKMDQYRTRMAKKKWAELWPGLVVEGL